MEQNGSFHSFFCLLLLLCMDDGAYQTAGWKLIFTLMVNYKGTFDSQN